MILYALSGSTWRVSAGSFVADLSIRRYPCQGKSPPSNLSFLHYATLRSG
jgi:hypothetical protein